MKFRLINSFKSYVKQNDKIIFILRLGILTIFEISFDKSDKYFKFLLLNLGFKISKK